MPTRTNKTTQDQVRGSSNKMDRQYYSEALWGTNNIGDARGVNNNCDVCGYTCVFMGID